MNDRFHHHCFACGSGTEHGLKLKFKLLRPDTLSGTCALPDAYQGYDQIVHGGIISTVLDASMVHLFYLSKGIALKTAKLNVRFRKPIPINVPVSISAVAEENHQHFYKAKAQLRVGSTLCAEAEGYFRK